MSDSRDDEEIQLPKCGRKGDAENLNEKKKENISEEEEIGKRKCRRKSRIDKFNEEVRVWTSSSKNHNVLLKNTDERGESLENTKRKLKQAALEWDDLDIQAELKSFMYVDHSLRGDPRKEKLIDELKFKNVCN